MNPRSICCSKGSNFHEKIRVNLFGHALYQSEIGFRIIFIFAAFTYFLIRIAKPKNWPVFFGLLFFLVNMALMLHVVAMSRFTIIADRYVYLASVGIFFIAAWYAVPWLQKMAVGGKKWILVVAACYLLYLGSYAHFRAYAWKDSSTLKREFQELVNDSLPKQKSKDHEN